MAGLLDMLPGTPNSAYSPAQYGQAAQQQTMDTAQNSGMPPVQGAAPMDPRVNPNVQDPQDPAIGARPFDPTNNVDDRKTLVDAVHMAGMVLAAPENMRNKVYQGLATQLIAENPSLRSIIDPQKPLADATLKALSNIGMGSSGNNTTSALNARGIVADPANFVRGQGASDVPGVSAGASDLAQQRIGYLGALARAQQGGDQVDPTASNPLDSASSGPIQVPPRAAPFSTAAMLPADALNNTASNASSGKGGKGSGAADTTHNDFVDPKAINDAYTNAQSVIGQANQMQDLLDNTPNIDNLVGPQADKGMYLRGLARVADRTLGLDIANEKDLAAQELIKQQAAQMALGYAKLAGGRLSAQAIKMFQQAVPGMGMTREAMQSAAQSMKETAYHNIEKSLFYENFKQKNGNLMGVNSAWEAHSANFPTQDGSLSNYMDNFQKNNPNASVQDALLYKIHNSPK